MSRVIITIPDELLTALDEQARKSTRSRSAIVRSVLTDWVANQQRAEFEDLLAAGYREMASALEEFAEDFSEAQAKALQATWRWDG